MPAELASARGPDTKNDSRAATAASRRDDIVSRFEMERRLYELVASVNNQRAVLVPNGTKTCLINLICFTDASDRCSERRETRRVEDTAGEEIGVEPRAAHEKLDAIRYRTERQVLIL